MSSCAIALQEGLVAHLRLNDARGFRTALVSPSRHIRNLFRQANDAAGMFGGGAGGCGWPGAHGDRGGRARRRKFRQPRSLKKHRKEAFRTAARASWSHTHARRRRTR